MPRACQICNHPDRLSIDRLLVQGKSKTKISLEFDVPTYSLDYHKEHHVSRQLSQHMDRKEAIDAVGLMDELQEIVADTKSIFKRNYLKDSLAGDSVALRALDSRRATFDTILKACQLYHQAKLLELETSQEHLQTEQQTRTQEGMSRLTFVELEVFYYLRQKMEGEMEGVEVPAVFRTPPPAPRPPLLPPRPKIPPMSLSKPVYAVEEPDPDQGEQGQEPPGLPPAPVREIPGGGRGLKLRRYLLGRKVLAGLPE